MQNGAGSGRHSEGYGSCEAWGWRETARPQVHGHDLHCCAFLPSHNVTERETLPSHSRVTGQGALSLEGHTVEGGERRGEGGGLREGAEEGASLGGVDTLEAGSTTRKEVKEKEPLGNPELVYASGAEEKVVRLFASPRTFLQTLGHASHKSQGPSASHGSQAPGAQGPGARAGAGGGGRGLETVAVGASMPALGLSQTPIYASNGKPPCLPCQSHLTSPEAFWERKGFVTNAKSFLSSRLPWTPYSNAEP